MGAAAAAIIIKREKEMIGHFRQAGATSAPTALSSGSLGVEENFIWRRLAESAVIRPAPNGGYYLDEPSWEALGRRRRRVAIIVMTAAIVLAIVLYFASATAFVLSRR